VVAVLHRVMPACFGVVFLRVTGVAVRGMSVVGGLLVIASLVMLGGLLVMLSGMFVMLGSLAVMFYGLLAHCFLPV
jgi:hypothetical protein